MKKSAIWGIGLSIVMVLHSVGGSVLYASSRAEIESRKNKLEQEKRSKEQELEYFNNKKTQTENYIQEVDKQLSEVSSKIYDLGIQSENKVKEIKKTNLELADATESMGKQYEDMKKRIQYMYEKGNQQFLDMLFSASSIADFLIKAEYVSKITDYDRDMLQKMRITKDKIETSKNKLEKDNKKLLALKEEQKEKQNNLSVLEAKKKRELTATEGNISTVAADITSITAQKQMAEAQLKEIERIETENKRKEEESRRNAMTTTQQTAPPASSDGQTGKDILPAPKKSVSNGYIWPLPAGYRRRTSRFGNRLDPFGSGKMLWHSGDDYSAPTGTPVYAVADGTVISSGYGYSVGNCVIIDHGSGLTSIYMHASVLFARVGQHVSQGDTISLVGTTGSSTAPHLHISFRLNGAWQDPENYIGTP